MEDEHGFKWTKPVRFGYDFGGYKIQFHDYPIKELKKRRWLDEYKRNC